MNATNQWLKVMCDNITQNENVNYTLEGAFVYFHDQKEISKSKYVWKLTFGYDGCIAFSADGGCTYQVTITTDFAVIAPDLIKTGFNLDTIDRIKQQEKEVQNKVFSAKCRNVES